MRLLLLSALLSVAACLAASPPAREVRSATYPPSFAYMSRAEIRTEMHKLASGVAKLDKLLRSEPPEVPVDQEAVTTVLENIDGVVSSLARSGQTTGHTALDENLQQFRRDVRAALESAKETPPDYFLAGSITGSCVYCHK